MNTPSPQPHFLYVFEMLSYGPPYPTKIGITKNIESRKKQLWGAYGGLIPSLRAYIVFPCKAEARAAELELIRIFTQDGFGVRELLAEPFTEIIAFLKERYASLGLTEITS